MASLQQIAIRFIKENPPSLVILAKHTNEAYDFILNGELPDPKNTKCYKIFLEHCQLRPESAAVFEYHITGNVKSVLGKRLRHKTIIKIEEMNRPGLPDYPKNHFYALCKFLGDSPYLGIQRKIFERNLDPTPVDPLIMEEINKVKNAKRFDKIDKYISSGWNERERQLFLEQFYNFVQRAVSISGNKEELFAQDIDRRISNGSYNGVVKKYSSPEYNGSKNLLLAVVGII
jgi:hypothetical protein